MLQRVAGCCNVARTPCRMLERDAYSVLQCVAVCDSVLQYVIVCCSVLQCVTV